MKKSGGSSGSKEETWDELKKRFDDGDSLSDDELSRVANGDPESVTRDIDEDERHPTQYSTVKKGESQAAR